MEKLTVVGNYVKSLEYLRSTECSQRQKLQHFHHISDCLASPSMVSNEHFGKHVSSGIAVLLLFCEDLDSVVRMSAEENLNRVIRSIENTRLSRVMLDLYNEIKKNGNQKSLRICLNLFAYYCPRMKEKNVKWYALKFLPRLQEIAQRKETLLVESLCEFMKCFSQHLQNYLNDNMGVKLMEIFLADIISDCAVKRRCSAQNCIYVIKGARSDEKMARKALNKSLDFLRPSELSTNKIIGVLGFFRLLLPIIVSFPNCENKQIVEIYDLCLHLLNNRNHSIINASLEVIHAVLNSLNAELRTLLISPGIHQNDFLKKRKSLKNQIFQLKNAEITCTTSASASASLPVLSTMTSLKAQDELSKGGGGADFSQQRQQMHALRKSSKATVKDTFKSGKTGPADGKQADERFSSEHDVARDEAGTVYAGQDTAPSSSTNEIKVNDEPETVQVHFTPAEFSQAIVGCVDDDGDGDSCRSTSANKRTSALTTLTTSTATGLVQSEPQEEGHLHCFEDKLQILSDVDNESFKSIDFESEITIGIGDDVLDDEREVGEENKDDKIQTDRSSEKNEEKAEVKSLKSADSIGAFFNNLLSHPNTGSMTKLFRTSKKLPANTTDNSPSSPTSSSSGSQRKAKQSIETEEMKSKLQPSLKPNSTTTTMASTTLTASGGFGRGILRMATHALEDDTISLESLSSHISVSSHVSHQSRGDQDLVLAPSNISEIEMKFDEGAWHAGDKTHPLHQELIRTVQQDNDQQNILLDASFESPVKGDSSVIGSMHTIEDTTNVQPNIGSIFDQNIVYYTARLVASKFLLGGIPGEVISDTTVRVSIKSLSLAVLANCVELKPEVLRLPLQIDKSNTSNIDISPDASNETSSESMITHDFYVDYRSEESTADMFVSEVPAAENTLEIKDDHFGVSPNPFIFDSPLSKSVDQALLAQMNNVDKKLEATRRDKSRLELSQQLEGILSKSEIIESKSSPCFSRRHPPLQRTTSKKDPLLNMPVDSNSKRCIKRIEKQQRKLSETESKELGASDCSHHIDSPVNSSDFVQSSEIANRQYEEERNQDEKQQFIHDIFLYCNHTDPVLRSNMQIIACNFAKACLSDLSRSRAGHDSVNMMLSEQTENRLLHGPFGIEELLIILIKGFRDEIHSVVIQALIAFDKLFSNLMLNYFTSSTIQFKDDGQISGRRKESERELIKALFNDVLELPKKGPISPKLLLNQLQLCFSNKYWLVQNKYADVISKLEFNAFREYYNDDAAFALENQFLEHLWQLLGDDDVRVRDHVAACVSDYVHKRTTQNPNIEMTTMDCDLKLVEEFLTQRVFQGMSSLLCELLKTGRSSNERSLSLLSRILFVLTNKLMDLDKKNMQFGIINAVRVLLHDFSPIDYLDVWNEFNFVEQCLCFMIQNFTTASDIPMQISLIEINTKLLSANLLVGNRAISRQSVDGLLEHVMKILSIYYYLFSNQKPPMISTKSLKSELLFGGPNESFSHVSEESKVDCLYVRLYYVLKVAFDNYKISINQESGNKFMSLSASCLVALSALLEFKEYSSIQSGSVKLIEEALQYLTVIVNYLPVETINCLRQLLKFLFCRNYGNRKVEYENFLKLYFAARHYERKDNRPDRRDSGKVGSGYMPAADYGREQDQRGGIGREIERQGGSGIGVGNSKGDRQDLDGAASGDRFNLSELFASAISFPLGKSKLEEDCTKHIKLFEPLVIYCLTLFMKSNARVQAAILDMLSDLLDFNVTYNILDSKHIIYEQVETNMELIDNGTARNADDLVRSTIRFLIKLTKQSDCKLISIPKVMSITNNLFINNSLHECSVTALKELSYEIFFKHPKDLYYRPLKLPNEKERNAEREVILRMLEKFIHSVQCQKMLATLLLWARSGQTKIMASEATSGVSGAVASDPISAITSASCDSSVGQESTIVQERAILSIVIGALQNDRIVVNNCETYFVLDAIFRNCDKSILLGSDLFESLLELFIGRPVENCNNLSCAVIILDNVILKTEQIYLANHVKLLFMKNNIQLNTDKSVLVGDKDELTTASRKQEKWQQQERDKSLRSRLAGDLGIGSSSTNASDDEINYFVKVLYSMLETCCSTSIASPQDTNYRYLTSKYMRLVIEVAVKFEKVRACLRILFTQNSFIYEKLECNTEAHEELTIDILSLLGEICLGRYEGDSASSNFSSFCLTLQPRAILQYTQKIKNIDGQRTVLGQVCEKFHNINWWIEEDIKALLSEELLQSFLTLESKLKIELLSHPIFSRLLMEQLLVLPRCLSKETVALILAAGPKINHNASFLKLKFLWRLLTDKSSPMNRSLDRLIQLHFNNEVESLESRLQRGDCKVHCSRNNDAIDVLKEISTGGYGEHLNKLSLSAQRVLRLFTNEEHLRNDNATSSELVYERQSEEKVTGFQQEMNEKWLMQQVVQMSSQADCKAMAKVLMDFKSEIKLKTIFNAEGFRSQDVLRPCLDVSFHSMITSFQNNCVQYNPHINYMNINPLLRVTLQVLFRNLGLAIDKDDSHADLQSLSLLILSLMKNLEKLETISLLYIKPSAIEKFVYEQLLKSQISIEKLLIEYAARIARHVKDMLIERDANEEIIPLELHIFLRCMDAIIKQNFVWAELNQPQKYEAHLNSILDMLHEGMTNSIRSTTFYKLYWLEHRQGHSLFGDVIEKSCIAEGMAETVGNGESVSGNETQTLRVRKAIFLGKLIEACTETYKAKIYVKCIYSRQLMKTFKSIAISLLRTNYYYGLAVVPYELFKTYSYDRQLSTYARLPSIPVDHLSDLDILRKFIKRLSIFGFCSRQQFEEYFMTFLLLINRVYDVNMVDEQEQFLIKNACITVIIELLVMCRTFPVVGTKLSQFHHTTRWPRIKCRNNISLKKLHKIQLIVPGSNVFYHPNLERDLRAIHHDSIIGTNYFLPNQYELNHVWQQMESLSNDPMNISSGGMDAGGDIGVTALGDSDAVKGDTSRIDLKSSCQLIFDVFTQMIELNHVLVLPNLVKFCEICDNREHIRWIKNTVAKLQEQIPFDDTISHQYIIYLLCRTQSILIPSFAELSHLCSIISTYLKSTHVFICNATLHGLLCLLECCSKTSTTLGKLSEELCLLREIIVGYITHHGIVEESWKTCSQTHTKLVWTLNFSLIEMTTKFVPDCHLLSNTIISANNILKRTTDEAVYLCVLHGLERIVVVNTTPKPICDKIEKLALELVKVENERFSLPALKLLLSCVYMGSSKQLEMTEHSNGIVQDDPEIIAQQTEKVDVLLHCIKSSTSSAAKIYGEVLCQIVRDLVPPNEILTKVIKEFLAINQPHCEVIARIVYQVFRSCIDSSFLHMLQDWLICSLPNFLNLPLQNGVWCLTIIFLSSSINLDLIKLFPFAVNISKVLSDTEVFLFMISAKDFYSKLNADQKTRFKEIFKDTELMIYKDMLRCL